MDRLTRFFLPLGLAALLTGCGGFHDGLYTAITPGPDSLGFQAYLTVTVQDGRISEAQFDAFDRWGLKKTENDEYASLMKTVTGLTPAEVSAHYRGLLLGVTGHSSVEVDALSGATVSSSEFLRLWDALEQPLSSGDTHPVTLEAAPEFVPSLPDE